jgi:hypothetical protein
MILVLGLPPRCVWMLSAAANRLRGSGWKNFAQTAAYSAALFAGLAITGGGTARTIAWCLVIARCVAAVASLDNLRQLTEPAGAPPVGRSVTRGCAPAG